MFFPTKQLTPEQQFENMMLTIYNRVLTEDPEVADISGEAKDHDLTKACMVVVARREYALSMQVKNWLFMIDYSQLGQRYPDPTGRLFSSEDITEVIEAAIEGFFFPGEDEKRLLPQLRDMSDNDKLAFVQERWGLWKTKEQILEEAQAMIERGDEIPPWKRT